MDTCLQSTSNESTTPFTTTSIALVICYCQIHLATKHHLVSTLLQPTQELLLHRKKNRPSSDMLSIGS
jgi:hypothetical protein